MIKSLGSESFNIRLDKTEEERGVSEYVIADVYDESSLRFDSVGFNSIDELIDLLKSVKANNIK